MNDVARPDDFRLVCCHTGHRVPEALASCRNSLGLWWRCPVCTGWHLEIDARRKPHGELDGSLAGPVSEPN